MIDERERVFYKLSSHFAEQLLEIWHQTPDAVPVHQWMGLTEEGYAAWVEMRWADVLINPSDGG